MRGIFRIYERNRKQTLDGDHFGAREFQQKQMEREK